MKKSRLEFLQRKYNIPTQSSLRVAVISDLQIPNSTDVNSHQCKSLESTLNMLKNKGMDVLIIAGDFTDLGTKTAWGMYKKIYDRAMADYNLTAKLCVIGNHDYWLPVFAECHEIPIVSKMQKRFTEYTGEPINSHNIINGYHFICWSSLNGSYDKSYTNKQAVKKELDKAIADNSKKPVFVITHINPQDTAYGSDEWGNKDVDDVLKDYPQAISISGHSHYSIIDERSIWQDKYTTFTTQSLDYIELEYGKFNGSIPKDAYGNLIAEKLPACLYMNIEKDKITIERLEANTGTTLKQPWVINAPFDKLDDFTIKRVENNKPPVIDENLKADIDTITDINGKAQRVIRFDAAQDDDFVHTYKLKFYDGNMNILSFDETDYDGNLVKYNQKGDRVSVNGKEYKSAEKRKISEVLYFSDFVIGLNNMSSTVELRLPSNIPQKAEYVGVTAIDSWGGESREAVCKI